MEVDSPRQIRTPKSKTKEYYRDYYHTHAKQIYLCPVWNCEVQGNHSKLRKHFNTNKCKKFEALVKQFSELALHD